ncbi:MAG TPA: hypothetical protein VGM03_20845 [Phycisphaerae bacterium]
MNRNAIQKMSTAVVMLGGLAWCAAAKAGPLPLDQLLKMRADTVAQIAEVKAVIERLTQDLTDAKRYLANLEKYASFTDPAAMSRAIAEAKARVADFQAQIAKYQAQLQVLVEQLNFIDVQIQAWHEIEQSRMKKSAGPVPVVTKD